MNTMTPVVGYTSSTVAEVAYCGVTEAAQRMRIAERAERENWHVLWLDDDGQRSGTTISPALTEALRLLSSGERGALVAASLRHVTRSTRMLSTLLHRSKSDRWSLVAPPIDTRSPLGQADADAWLALLHFQHESRSASASEALAERAARGVQLGRPLRTPHPVIDRIVTERDAGATLREIADRLTADHIHGSQGAERWHPSTVASVLRTAERMRGAINESTTVA